MPSPVVVAVSRAVRQRTHTRRRDLLGLLGLQAGAPLLSLLPATTSAAAPNAPLDIRVTDAAGKPVSGAVVFLDSPQAHEQVRPLAGAEVAQVERRFAPAVSVVTLGTPVTFPNLDTVRHHIYSFSPIKRFEIKLYVGTPTAPVVFDQPGIAVLGCNIHDQMAAWIVVVATPWFGRTDDTGRWTASAAASAPPGRYALRAWHAGMPAGAAPVEQALTVEAAGARAVVIVPSVKA
jgi:plastocyanin